MDFLFGIYRNPFVINFGDDRTWSLKWKKNQRVKAGLPEWYKTELAEKAFNES